MKLKLNVALVLAIMVIGGCGQKGPLYLPEDEEDEEQASVLDSVDTTVENVFAAGPVTLRT
tara:strand:+ start:128 stop:310 length:183 start_codon:yes stop_codon:yes gene_type:complete